MLHLPESGAREGASRALGSRGAAEPRSRGGAPLLTLCLSGVTLVSSGSCFRNGGGLCEEGR